MTNLKKIFDDETEIIESYLERGKNYVIFEKYSDAIEDLTKVIEFLPDDEIYFDKLFMAYYSRGFAYKKLKKFCINFSLCLKISQKILSSGFSKTL